MLATSCRRLLALRLPQNLSAWATALVHIEPWTLLDIMSSDHLAVPTEYDRYELVKQVAKICAAAEAAAGTVEDAVVGKASDDNDGEGFAAAGGSTTTRTIVVQRMLSSALRLSGEGLTGHLDLARPCPSPGVACPGASLAAPGTQSANIGPTTDANDNRVLSSLRHATLVSSSSISAGVGDTDSDVGLACTTSPIASATGTSPSECTGADGASILMSSQASSRSTFRLDELGSGATVVERIEDAVAPPEEGGDQTVVKTAVAIAAAAPQQPSQSPMQVPAGINGMEVPDLTGSPVAAGSGVGVVATAAARLLLNQAVRYEHLTVPQLMAVEREGLVPAHVLHAALWERTRLDCEIHYRGMQPYKMVAASNGEAAAVQLVAARGGEVDAIGTPEESVQVGMQPLQSRFRAFRICWRLTCGAMRKLQLKGLLQSELYQYAGALWQLRLCCSGGSRSHLGLFVGRHLAAGVMEGSTAALWQQRQGARASPARQLDPGREAEPLVPRRRRPGRHVRRQLPLEPPVTVPQQQQAPPAQQFFAYRDYRSSLRAQCRLSVFQSDNTALQGRLCLGDTGDFTADFAAGGYFGQAQLVARADLVRLADEQEVFVFMSLQVLMDDV
ncbi:hypothetical protein Vretimale_15184 [Volvox reticuliferus]|nr:hypothetical protein Vretimale_15184 [Volvox reticuliferus]